VNVCDVLGGGLPPPPPEGERECEQPYAARKVTHARAKRNLNRLLFIPLSFRSSAILRPSSWFVQPPVPGARIEIIATFYSTIAASFGTLSESAFI